MNLRVEQLRRFTVLAEELSFTRAAARVHVTQQVLSAQIRALEAQVGTPLVHRTTRRVELTAAGHAFLPRAVLAVAQADDAVLAAREAAGRRRLLLACEIDAQWLMSEELTAFRAAHPQVEVVPVYVLDLSALDAFTPSRIDAIVAWVAPPAGTMWEHAAPLATEEAHIVVRSGDRLARRRRVKASELGGRTVWMWPPRTGAVAWRHLAEHVGATEDRIGLVGGPDGDVGPVQELMLQAVQAHGGCTFAPASFLRRSPARPGLAAIRLDPPLHVPLVLAWRGVPSSALRTLLEHVGAPAPAGPRVAQEG